jgi:maleate isomerase
MGDDDGNEGAAMTQSPARDRWQRLQPTYAPDAAKASLGVIGLSTDRVGTADFVDFLTPLSHRAAVFGTRVPMSPVATPETLAAMGEHLAEATRLIVPGTPLDVIAFSCTSGTVAIGTENVRAAIQSARPGVAVSTPMEGGARALKLMGARRIVLLTPYRVRTAELVAGFFEQADFAIVRCGTFDLDGDPDMNRVSADAIIAAAAELCREAPGVDAVFVSCTGLRTCGMMDRLEAAVGKPAVSSNQALAWDSLRKAGVTDAIQGQGSLLRSF